MLTILLHSSKTMRYADSNDKPYQAPQLLLRAELLANYLSTLSLTQIEDCMNVSRRKAETVQFYCQYWSSHPQKQQPAIDAFLGDIYSGLQVQTFNSDDRVYANEHLIILSGLYGGLKALDSVDSYRLEMGYGLPDKRYSNLYRFWGDSIAELIPRVNVVINLSAVEYTKAVLPYIKNRVITPKFMTVSPKTGEPTFVTVHAKIARGAFAHWLITNRISDTERLPEFQELGYQYDDTISTPEQPVFICQQFKGLGLSVRLT